MIELARNPDKQDRLREEVTKFPGTDPTYDDFINGFPYLDSVIREALRMHPPLLETIRVVSPCKVIAYSPQLAYRSPGR